MVSFSLFLILVVEGTRELILTFHSHSPTPKSYDIMKEKGWRKWRLGMGMRMRRRKLVGCFFSFRFWEFSEVNLKSHDAESQSQNKYQVL